jgi:hypothetical protein
MTERQKRQTDRHMMTEIENKRRQMETAVDEKD